MKSLPLICLIFCCCFNLEAQETTPSNKEYLFDSFTDGKALLKNKRFNQTKFNYNCVYQELHFLNNGEDMTMDNNSNIDTIYIDNRKFIPHLNRFLEYIPVNNTVLLVDYKTKAVPFAKKRSIRYCDTRLGPGHRCQPDPATEDGQHRQLRL